MGIFKNILNVTKEFIGKVSVTELLKQVSRTALDGVEIINILSHRKSDYHDYCNMIYHHNINNDHKVNVALAQNAYLMNELKRYFEELSVVQGEDKPSMDAYLTSLYKMSNGDKEIGKLIYEYKSDNIITNFDQDSIETSWIIGTQDLNEGKIYSPDRSIILLTDEGQFMADAKNDYLEGCKELGSRPSREMLQKLIMDYHKKVNTREAQDYFNKINNDLKKL